MSAHGKPKGKRAAAALDWREYELRVEVARAVAVFDECALGGDPPRPLYAYDSDERLVTVMRCAPWNLDPSMYEIETRNILARYGERYWPLHLLPPELRKALIDKWAARERADDAANPELKELEDEEDEDND
jgi:hypothetical protein